MQMLARNTVRSRIFVLNENHFRRCLSYSRNTKEEKNNIAKIRSASTRSQKVESQNALETTWLTIKKITRGAKHLWNDYLTYDNINAAVKTKVNAWKGKIPRRQHEQQRLFRYDAMKVAPTAVMFLVPFVKYVIGLVAMYAFPKQLLSRHFWTERQKRLFTHQSYEAKQQHFLDLLNAGLGGRSDLMRKIENDISVTVHSYDRAGPVISAKCAVRILVGSPPNQATIDDVFDEISKFQLTRLARAKNAYSFPFLPKLLLKHNMKTLACDIARDDALLIKENKINEISDEEIVLACDLRSLPTHSNIAIFDMREVSTMIRSG